MCWSPVFPEAASFRQRVSPRTWARAAQLGLLLAAIPLSSCQREPSPAPLRVLGEAFGGPMQAVIRQELSPRSPAVAEIRHGERVELLERRRRFYKVRTSAGAIGWIDGRQLMNAAQLRAIAELSAEHKDTPRIGQATVYEPLNVHSEPNRQAPSFAQIPERGLADVLLYRSAPREPFAFPPLIEERRPEPRAGRKQSPKVEKADQLPPPPPPPPPAPPEDWLELSRPVPLEDRPQPSVPMDDWTLVRLPDGRVGWALSRMLVMAIPDEVAQYSEGHRIMGYWPVGEVMADGVKHQHWLWVTQSQKNVPFAFDGFRVFMYAARRKRYEQAYREKNVEGHFPVEVVRPGRKKEYLAEFTIISRRGGGGSRTKTGGDSGERGALTKRTFAFLGYQVVKLDEQPYTTPAPPPAIRKNPAPPPAPPKPWYRRLLPRLGQETSGGE